MSRVSRMSSAQLACLAVLVSTTSALATEDIEAMAAPPLATCVGSHRQTFTPGLRLFPALVHYTEDVLLSTCVSQDPTLGSVSYRLEGDALANCALATMSGRLNLTWSSGETSVVELAAPLVISPVGQAVTTSYGRVASGKFAGALVINVADIQPSAPAALACLSTGLALSMGVTSMTFLQLAPPIPPLPVPNPTPTPTPTP
ncbi:hypothetical protein MYSTI_05246 [Myxococcus stipitatus DSM 14675]|uniref:Lipoprotein n=1 Tax=Myxococcus stipitatus (strain DSM 14675 / JCM 12634 / Mx s8) TaxID=1278073 RepID=L7UG29_MYXSD|nr:hypothetical protein [Myxococcus stipitatus]AGC46527.1 hypothetical protein MYSTI_05246 [Myxococcus stipitatus DSM 14675]